MKSLVAKTKTTKIRNSFVHPKAISCLLGVFLFSVACSAPTDTSSPGTNLSDEGVESIDVVSEDTASDATANPWSERLGRTKSPAWKVAACDGELPLLCVSDKNKNQVGTVELQTWALEDRSDLSSALGEVGLDPDSIDLSTSSDQEKTVEALKILVHELHSTIEQDWLTGSGDTIDFEAKSPRKINVGSLPGVRYQFQTIEPDGAVQQMSVGYMVFDGTTLYVISTGAAFEEAPGFSNVDQLQAFRPYLNKIVKNLKL
jgi:hypothetical protein